MKKAKEFQNQIQFDEYEEEPVVLGPYTSFMWRRDPKHLGFLFARYKFVSKLLAGKNKVLEVGCGDAIGTSLVAQAVGHVYCTDFESLLLEDNRKRLHHFKNISFSLLDITNKPFNIRCNAAFSLDVIEHIPPADEHLYFDHICKSLTTDGICIIGTPNVSAQQHASEASRLGHVNLKSYEDFQVFLKKYFVNGFLFSMNDEIVHTGFYPMAHYLVGVGVGVKKRK